MKRLILSIICVLTLTSLLTACGRLTTTQEDTYVSDSWQDNAVGAMKYIKGIDNSDRRPGFFSLVFIRRFRERHIYYGQCGKRSLQRKGHSF